MRYTLRNEIKNVLVLLFIATGCSNSTGSGGGSDSGGVKGSVDEGTQTVSASTVEKGIKVTVDVPEISSHLWIDEDTDYMITRGE